MLNVHNFYTKDKISTNRYHNLLMANALFYILVSKDGKFRELALNITKKFHYERYVSYGDFDTNKANEYNVLVDFIKHNKELLIAKWNLEEGEFEDLLDGLKACLIKNYNTCSGLRHILLFAAVMLGIVIHRILRRFKR